MKPIYAFNDVLFEIWPIDQYARSHLTTICEQNNISFSMVVTTMGMPSWKFEESVYKDLKYKLTE